MGKIVTLAVLMLSLSLSFHFWGLLSFVDAKAAHVETEATKKGGQAIKKSVESAGAKAKDTPMEEAIRRAKESARAAKKIVVAKVNDANITMYDLIRKMNVMAPKFLKPGERPDEKKTEEIKKAALDALIFEELAYQEAKKRGIKPPPGKVENILTNIRMSLGPEENYKKFLDRLDLTEDQYINVIVRGQILDLIFQKEIYDKVKVDEDELKALYEKEKERLVLPERYEVTDVAFLGKTPDIEKKAQTILKKIKENGNDPWKLVQDGTFIVRTYWVKEKRNPALYKAMKKMKPGDLSGVIEDKDGYHIIRVEKKEESRVATLEEARKYLERRLKRPAYQKRKDEWENELRKDAKIDVYWDRIEQAMNKSQKQPKN